VLVVVIQFQKKYTDFFIGKYEGNIILETTCDTNNNKKTQWPLVHNRTIQTELPPLVDEI
jgi:hypothetical protein